MLDDKALCNARMNEASWYPCGIAVSTEATGRQVSSVKKP